MAWTHPHFLPSVSSSLYNRKVEWVRSFKYLGVILDDNLSFTLYSQHVCSRAGKRLSIFKQLAVSPYGSTQQTLLHYYKTNIRPILEYGMSICNQAYELLQNTALLIALHLPPNARTNFVLAEAGCSLLEDRIKSLAMSTWTKIKSSPSTHKFHQNYTDMHTSMHLHGRTSSGVRYIPLEISLIQTAESTSIPEVRSRITTPNNHLNPITGRTNKAKLVLTLYSSDTYSLSHLSWHAIQGLTRTYKKMRENISKAIIFFKLNDRYLV